VEKSIAGGDAGQGNLPGDCYQLCSDGGEQLANGRTRGKNAVMRALALVLVAALILFGVYEIYLKKMPTTDAGTATTQAINLTGVRMDLLQIAQAERGNMALNSTCASLDEMISSGSLSMPRSGRDGYTYEVNCRGGADFQVVARHAPAPEGSPIRFPILAIDSSLQVGEIQ
jgi:hypothetical protein